MKRFVKEYANDKIRRIENGRVILDTESITRIAFIKGVLRCHELGDTTIDEVMLKISNI